MRLPQKNKRKMGEKSSVQFVLFCLGFFFLPFLRQKAARNYIMDLGRLQRLQVFILPFTTPPLPIRRHLCFSYFLVKIKGFSYTDRTAFFIHFFFEIDPYLSLVGIRYYEYSFISWLTLTLDSRVDTSVLAANEF